MRGKVSTMTKVKNSFKLSPYDNGVRNIDQDIFKKTRIVSVVVEKKRNKDGIILPKCSVSSFNTGHGITKSWVDSGMKLETWIYDNPNYDISDGFSDYPPSYVIYKKRTKPLKEDKGHKTNWYSLFSVHSRHKSYLIQDNRMLSKYYGDIFKKFTLDELIQEITRDDVGISSIEFMRLKNISSLTRTGSDDDGFQVYSNKSIDKEKFVDKDGNIDGESWMKSDEEIQIYTKENYKGITL